MGRRGPQKEEMGIVLLIDWAKGCSQVKDPRGEFGMFW